MFFSHWLLSASSAVILFSGSNVSILSKRSSAESGMYANSSRNRLRYCFFCTKLPKCGSFMTLGQTAGVGDPHKREIISSCRGSELPWNSVFFAKSSPRMQPTLQMSIDGPYLKQMQVGQWLKSLNLNVCLTFLLQAVTREVGTKGWWLCWCKGVPGLRHHVPAQNQQV